MGRGGGHFLHAFLALLVVFVEFQGHLCELRHGPPLIVGQDAEIHFVADYSVPLCM